MPKYNTRLIKRDEIASGTMAFHLEKPADFEFKAGQFMEVTIPNPPETDAEGNTRAFSIIASPDEDYIGFATRMRDTAFKRVMKTTAINLELQVEAPFGDFIMHNDVSKPAVFLSGGIGITPFFSIIKDAAKRQLLHRIFLFYSNRRPEDAAFLTELQALQQQNQNYKFIGTMTEMEKSGTPWTGETGYINKEMLQKYISDLAAPIYYSAGPPAMVAAMRKMLNDSGINDDNIKVEEFSGY